MNVDAFPEYITILVPEADVATYRTADVWSDIAVRIISKNAQRNRDIIITETPVTGSAVQNAIGESNLGNVTTLKITGNINSYDIFVMRNNMPNLHVIDFSDANIVASDYKYYSSYNTEDNIFPQCGFYEQNKLTQIIFPKSITAIGDYALFGCHNMMKIDMYPGIVTIGEGSFQQCDKIKELIIPEGVETLGFSMCWNGHHSMNSLKRVCLPSTLKKIEDGCFGELSSLKEINFPSCLEYIGYLAFSFTKLREINLPSSLTYIGDNAFRECSALRIVRAAAIDPNSVQISDNSFDNYSNKTLYLPIDEETGWDATYNAYYWHTQWGQFNTKLAWNPTYDKVNVNSDYDQAQGTIPGENIDATLGENAGYILGADAEQSFDEVHVQNNGTDGGSIIDKDDNLTANTLVCDINVQANRWYFFCFPFDVNIATDITAPGESVWRKYNAAVRASNGRGGWQKHGDEDKTLRAGKGYIFQCNTAGTLVIRVENPDFNADNKSPQLEEHVAANAQDASWNFVGNPYLSYYELDNLDHNAPVTIWNGSGYEAVRPGDDDYAFHPFQAFFVQKTAGSDEVGFDKDQRETKQQSENKGNDARMMRAQQMINPDRLLINLELTDGVTTDKTRVVFNNKHQMEYEPECDAAKFMSSEQVPQLYTYYNNVNYAINERPNNDTEVKLAFTAPKEGEYTISVSRMDTPVLLLDAETGITFDFQAGSYTFNSKAGQFDKRFLLVKNNSETAIQPVTVGDAQNAMYFKMNGVKTDANAKGIIVSNGKKMLKK